MNITYRNLLGIAQPNPINLLEWDGGVVMPVSRPTPASVGDLWVDLPTDSLYETYIVGGANTVLPVTEPATNEIGDRWFNETTDTLYTAVAQNDWTGATEEVLPLTMPTVDVSLNDQWFDEDTNTLWEVFIGNTLIEASMPINDFTPNAVGNRWFDENTNTLYTTTGESVPYTLLDPTVTDGYVFSGWSTDPVGAVIVTEVTDYTEQTLYAQWDRIGKHIVLHTYKNDNFILRVNVDFIVEVKPIKMLISGSQNYRNQVIVSPGSRYYLTELFDNVADALEARDTFLALCI